MTAQCTLHRPIGVLVGVVNPNLGEEEVLGARRAADGTIRNSVSDFL